MVHFVNIRTDKNFIYADAIDVDHNYTAKIKLSKHQEKLEITNLKGEFDYLIRKGCWALQSHFEENGNKIESEWWVTWY